MTERLKRLRTAALPAWNRATLGQSTSHNPHANMALALCLALASAGLVAVATMSQPPAALQATDGGLFWHLPVTGWLGVVVLAGCALLTESRVARLVSVVAFGLVTIGMLSYLEPLGVFHDSWQNVGLGQISVSPLAADTDAARQVTYVTGSPGAFLFFGILSHSFADIPGFLRAYPVLCVLFYCAGLYALAVAFADAHGEHLVIDRARFGLLSVFAFLALAPLLQVRINPAPQSLAYALMPFCLAAVLRAREDLRFRLLALLAFAVIVLMHPITALMVAGLVGAWWLIDTIWHRVAPEHGVVASNTALLYCCLFLFWLVFIGVWVINTGGSLFRRLLEVFNSGQHAAVSAGAVVDPSFVWTHRVALAAAGLLIAAGVLLTWRAQRLAGARLVAWCALAAIWLPQILLGEFADRGPLFAALPGALAAGLALSRYSRGAVRWALLALVLVTASTGYVTAYSNHVGEVITVAEVRAFAAIAGLTGGRRIVYAYVPPLSAPNLTLYTGGQAVAYPIGAADFTYERLKSSGNVIVVSDQMRQAAVQRGPAAAAALDQFETQIQADPEYRIIYDNGSVRAYSVR